MVVVERPSADYFDPTPFATSAKHTYAVLFLIARCKIALVLSGAASPNGSTILSTVEATASSDITVARAA